jgi:hypothetical protein
MAVPVMQIGVMRVLVPHGLMTVPMRMRFGHRSIMVLMVSVMHMRVVVFQSLVVVPMVMPFGQVQP